MSNSNDRILRFHIADKVFHSLNAILWFALVITGAIVYLADCENATGEMLMSWHLGLGIVFTLNLVGYLLFAPERFGRNVAGKTGFPNTSEGVALENLRF